MTSLETRSNWTTSLEVISCREAAKRLNCSKNTITTLIRIKNLTAVTDERGRTVGVTPESFYEFWERKANCKMRSAPRGRFVPPTPEQQAEIELEAAEAMKEFYRLCDEKNLGGNQ